MAKKKVIRARDLTSLAQTGNGGGVSSAGNPSAALPCAPPGAPQPDESIFRRVPALLADFTSNFAKALFLFAVFTTVRLLAEGLFAGTFDPYQPAPAASLGRKNSLSDEVPAETLFKLAGISRDAGFIGDALDYYDLVIYLTKNSNFAQDQVLLSQSLVQKGSLLLVVLAKVLRLDERALTIEPRIADHYTIGIARWPRGGLQVLSKSDIAFIGNLAMPFFADTYLEQSPDRLMDEAIHSFTLAARSSAGSKEGLSMNLGLGVLTSQIFRRTANERVLEVVRDVHESFSKLAAEEERHYASNPYTARERCSCRDVVKALRSIIDSAAADPRADVGGLLRRELIGDPTTAAAEVRYLDRIRGVAGMLEQREKRARGRVKASVEDREWEALKLADYEWAGGGSGGGLAELDEATLHGDAREGLFSALAAREQFFAQVAKEPHVAEITLLAADKPLAAAGADPGEVVFLSKTTRIPFTEFLPAVSPHVTGEREMLVGSSFFGDAPGVPQEVIELAIP
ncbi:hypothetical protein DIPPA_16062 [Diplonema papillatum]|nr:hypothetical protein DIPPA_16062 [Diplonema papillatum]